MPKRSSPPPSTARPPRANRAERVARLAKSRAARSGARSGTEIPATQPRRRRPASPPRSVSRSDLSQRRQTLRRKRGVNHLKQLWRLAFVGAAAVGLGWLMTQPIWVLSSPEQIHFKGNVTASEAALRALVPIDYPQSLLKLEPRQLETDLLAKAPLQSAQISRQIFPPGLQIQVQERHPVAIAELMDPLPVTESVATSDASTRNASTPSNASTSGASAPEKPAVSADRTPAVPPSPAPTRPTQVLLDETGEWVPLDHYQAQGQLFQLPKLKVLGMRAEYRQAWSELYQVIRQSPIQVSEIDWRNPSNIKLKTDLGEVHVGPYSPQFAQQLEVLDRMRHLANHQEANRVEFIDLRIPSVPRLTMKSELRNPSPEIAPDQSSEAPPTITSEE